MSIQKGCWRIFRRGGTMTVLKFTWNQAKHKPTMLDQMLQNSTQELFWLNKLPILQINHFHSTNCQSWIALTSTWIHHIKNAPVVGCMPKKLNGVHPHLSLIHSFSILLIIAPFTTALVKCCLPIFNFLFTFILS